MSGFAVIRHPETGGLGIAPATSLVLFRANGWVRVSDYRDEPGDFHLPDFAEALDDLDAEPAPKAKAKAWTKAETTKESSA